MGTTTFFLKNNDLGKPVNTMGKGELDKLSNLSPYAETSYYHGWQVPLELHNGNVYVLVFWKGRLIRIEDAPKILRKKYYSKHRGKEVNEYEWTVLRKYMVAEVHRLDKEFKKLLRKKPALKHQRGVKGRKGR